MITLRYYLWMIIMIAVFASVLYTGLKALWYGPKVVNKKSLAPLPASKVLQAKPFNGSAGTYVR